VRRFELASIMKVLDSFRLALSQREAEATALEERTLELERQMRAGVKVHEQQAELIRHLQARLNAYITAGTRPRGDVASNAHASQETIAHEVRQFIEQRLQNIARNRIMHADGLARHPRRQQIPRLLGALCEILFGERGPDFHELRALLNIPEYGAAFEAVSEAYSKACEFRERGRASGLKCEWIFDVAYGAPLNPDRQEVWPSCDQERPVLFVVAPGYVVDGQLFLQQRVFTG
jgi:hypothetical protein